jgi:preprotein translocase subunit SecF
MQFFPVGKVYDFMGPRWYFIGASVLLVALSLIMLVWPGPRMGTDFAGGTEVEIAFQKGVSPEQIRDAVEKVGLSRPDVIRVQDPKNQFHYLIRVQDVSTIGEDVQRAVEKRLCFGQGAGTDCAAVPTEVKFSPGGEKITLRFDGDPDLGALRSAVSGIDGIDLRPGENNPSLQNARDHRVEIALMGKSDQIMAAFQKHLPEGTTPEAALRTEWVGPKVGAQLRDSAIKSIAITLLLILVYVAFRFDVRFAPGGILALAHDAIGTLGILMMLGKEFNLTTVAAILTIIGFSVSDTVVVYDRVRENLGKVRGANFADLINLSISEMLGRTVLTSGTVLMAIFCFFIWGTGVLKDFALSMTIGLILGMYSSIYVALPLTEWLDRAFFQKAKAQKA